MLVEIGYIQEKSKEIHLEMWSYEMPLNSVGI